MNVYVDNELANAGSIVTNNIADGYLKEMLYDDSVSNVVIFTGCAASIQASWEINHFIDSVAILNSNWVNGQLKIISNEQIVFENSIFSKGKNTIIKLPRTVMITNLEITLNAIDNLEVGILFIGKRIELPLFNTGFSYKSNIESKGERTRYGIVYGQKLPVLRSFEVSFQDIDNERRQIIDRYIDAVQYVQPHLVEPYETEAFPPVWATLSGAGDFSKEKGSGWYWNTKLEYLEAK